MILADYYNVAICCVSCVTKNVLKYNDHDKVRGTIWLLYTGEHYDPLVVEEPKCLLIGKEYDQVEFERQSLVCLQSLFYFHDTFVDHCSRKSTSKSRADSRETV